MINQHDLGSGNHEVGQWAHQDIIRTGLGPSNIQAVTEKISTYKSRIREGGTPLLRLGLGTLLVPYYIGPDWMLDGPKPVLIMS